MPVPDAPTRDAASGSRGTRVRVPAGTPPHVRRATSGTGVIEIGVAPLSTQLRRARRTLRDQLDVDALGRDHVGAVEAVANELLGASCDGGAKGELVLSVESFALLTSVRVRCPRGAQLRDEPFGMRERVLDGYAFAWGKRQRLDGTIELWAELARPARAAATAERRRAR